MRKGCIYTDIYVKSTERIRGLPAALDFEGA